MDYPKINVQFGRVYIIPMHYLTYWRLASPTTNSEIWMTSRIRLVFVSFSKDSGGNYI
jgi:hypothetical protein